MQMKHMYIMAMTFLMISDTYAMFRAHPYHEFKTSNLFAAQLRQKYHRQGMARQLSTDSEPKKYNQFLSHSRSLQETFNGPRKCVSTQEPLFAHLALQAVQSKPELARLALHPSLITLSIGENSHSLVNDIKCAGNGNPDTWMNMHNTKKGIMNNAMVSTSASAFYTLLHCIPWDGTRDARNGAYSVLVNGVALPLHVVAYYSKMINGPNSIEVFSAHNFCENQEHHNKVCGKLKELRDSYGYKFYGYKF